MLRPLLILSLLTLFSLGGCERAVMHSSCCTDMPADIKAAKQRQDYETAMKILQPQADQGNAEAQFKIGLTYNDGWGVKQDYAEAYFWFSLASTYGSGAAVSFRDETAPRLTPGQKAAANKRVADWLKDHPAPAAAGERWVIQMPNTLDKDKIMNAVKNTQEYLQSHNVPSEGPDR
jgi:TPR repeat protein